MSMIPNDRAQSKPDEPRAPGKTNTPPDNPKPSISYVRCATGQQTNAPASNRDDSKPDEPIDQPSPKRPHLLLTANRVRRLFSMFLEALETVTQEADDSPVYPLASDLNAMRWIISGLESMLDESMPHRDDADPPCPTSSADNPTDRPADRPKPSRFYERRLSRQFGQLHATIQALLAATENEGSLANDLRAVLWNLEVWQEVILAHTPFHRSKNVLIERDILHEASDGMLDPRATVSTWLRRLAVGYPDRLPGAKAEAYLRKFPLGIFWGWRKIAEPGDTSPMDDSEPCLQRPPLPEEVAFATAFKQLIHSGYALTQRHIDEAGRLCICDFCQDIMRLNSFTLLFDKILESHLPPTYGDDPERAPTATADSPLTAECKDGGAS